MNDLTAVSLFAGVGGFDRALELAGVRVVAAVEIDADCRGVLAAHFAETALFDDITEVTGEQLRAAGFAPRRGILAGGWPCQDLSVAGRRAGLGGARSGLFWEVVRLADELLPQWLVLENVPGLLSAVCPCPGDEACIDNGRSLACGRWETRAGQRTWLDHVTHTPQGGGCYGGCMEQHGGAMGSVVGALEQLGYGLCWRVLDSRYFGVPQRRERVFFVGCLGDGASPVEILLEPESGDRHFAPGESARARPARAAETGSGISRPSRDIAQSLTSNYGKQPDNSDTNLDTNLGPTLVVTAATLQGGGRRGHRIDAEGAAGGHLIPVSSSAPFPSRDVSHAITSREGKGADSDATSGFIVQPVALRGRDSGGQIEIGEPGDPAFTLRTPAGGGSYPMIAHALTSEGADASEDGTGRGTPIVVCATGETTHALTASPGSGRRHVTEDGTGRGTPLVAATLTSGRAAGEGVNDPGRRSEDDVNLVAFANQHRVKAGALAEPLTGSHGQPGGDASGTAVRRLTPLECERLQAFPDDWTRWKLVDGKLAEQSDSARYRQVGNAVTTSVVEWIARRLVASDERWWRP